MFLFYCYFSVDFFSDKYYLRDIYFKGDALSPKAVRQGIESSMSETGEYPLWLPWMFSGLPSLHSFQNISQFYFL